MGDVNLEVWDATGNKRLKVQVPDDVAVERVWNSGVIVVTAAGNTPGAVTTPGDDPYVITAGSSDDHTTPTIGDDTLAAFSGMGPTADGFAKPDFVAPGKSVVSLRSPGSTIDAANPTARIGTDYFKGSGTSFSAAITSGTAALVLSRDRTLSPNQVKARLVRNARNAPLVQPAAARGAGELDAFGATMSTDPGSANAGLTPSTFFGVSGGDPLPAGSSWGGIDSGSSRSTTRGPSRSCSSPRRSSRSWLPAASAPRSTPRSSRSSSPPASSPARRRSSPASASSCQATRCPGPSRTGFRRDGTGSCRRSRTTAAASRPVPSGCASGSMPPCGAI